MKITKYFKQKFNKLNYLFDSHAHLSSFDKGKLKGVVKGSIDSDVKKIVTIAVNLEDSKKNLEIARHFPGKVFPAVGIDPEVAVPGSDIFETDLNEEKIDKMLEEFELLVEENRESLIMLGETGLDYYWIYKNDLSLEQIEQSKTLQKRLFRKHLELSEKYQLPLSIHHRDSYKDCLELAEEYPGAFGIFHSFVDGVKEAKEIIEAGYGLGINGIVTYQSAESIRDALRAMLPEEIESPKQLYDAGIFLETDSPYLTPKGAKERTNYPQNIRLIYDYISELTH